MRETGRSPDSLRSAPASREEPCGLEPLARPGAARLRGSPRSAPGHLEESRDPEPIRPDRDPEPTRRDPPAMGRRESRGVPRSGGVGPARGAQIAGRPEIGRGRSRGVPRSGALRAAVRSNSRCSRRRRPEIALSPEALTKPHAGARSPRPPEPSKIELGLVETSGVALNYGRQETVTLLTLGVLRCLERARRALYLPAHDIFG